MVMEREFALCGLDSHDVVRSSKGNGTAEGQFMPFKIS